MRIGAFAEAAGVSVDAVRFYERRGVLHPAPRTDGGYRTFDDHALDRVRLARQFQQLGLTVEEVVDALSAHDVGDATCASERWRLEAVEARIDDQLTQLRRTRRLVRDALAACEDGHCRFAADAPTAPPDPSGGAGGVHDHRDADQADEGACDVVAVGPEPVHRHSPDQ